jgi:hypothetical protein
MGRSIELTPPPETVNSMMEEDPRPELELLPTFASSIHSIAPLRVETASGKKVIFTRRAKPLPKPIPVCPPSRSPELSVTDTLA